MKNNLKLVTIKGEQFTIEGNTYIDHILNFLTTQDLDNEDFKKYLVNFVNGFIKKTIGENDFIKQESVSVEEVNKLIDKIDDSYHEIWWSGFKCKVEELKEPVIESLKFIPPNVNVKSISDLKELGIETLDLSTLELLNRTLGYRIKRF